MNILNKPPDISTDFDSFGHTYYVADALTGFDPKTGEGKISYTRQIFSTLLSFNSMDRTLIPTGPNEFPPDEYEESPQLPFSVEFISERTIRIRAKSGYVVPAVENEQSLMLDGTPAQARDQWNYTKLASAHKYTSTKGAIIIHENPWKIEVFDSKGKLLTSTNHPEDNKTTFTHIMPFAWVRRVTDYSRSFSAPFNLSPGEKIFGFGEYYTEFNKRGQKVVLFTDDARGSQNEKSHKPIPFFMSNKGYGMLVHTSAPVTCDVGKYYNGVNSIYVGDDELDLFVFIGEPKDILNEYTNLTGKAPMPPLWSFGFWISRITYLTEKEGREVAAGFRKNKIPCDVIHYDSGWFEKDIRCDYEFSTTRFDDPKKLIADLRKDGFRVSLWQLPYFVPANKLFPEIIEKGLYVRDAKGNLPYEDAILDFTNPATVEWYQQKLARLLEMGVSAIKVDFGEEAPPHGIYHNGKTGYYEHNLYTTRYNKAVAEITQKVTGENIIWGRSGWTGSHRYPVHWGGDACTSDSGMAGVVRGGLSIGLSGFSFWSHDIGGFVAQTPEDLYRRWLAFGVLSSHPRSHGQPPREPWEYSESLVEDFRNALNMRYRLMPYIYAQALHSSQNGLPMMRALFLEYPQDPGAWTVDDQYLFGSDILVAPLLEKVDSRDVYLPGNHSWIDYQTGKVYQPGWNHIEAGTIPVIMLVRDGAVIPHIELAQSTQFMNWTNIELKVFSVNSEKADGLFSLPSENRLTSITVDSKKQIHAEPGLSQGEVKFRVSH
jgi:alpha-D-xyloside xylohydrolase